MQQDASSEEWFHVTHRGVGRRPVFARAGDINTFLGLLAREVERGAVEVHAYAVLTNHCHLLVRARQKEISGALRRVFGVYSKQLNRRLRRDGALFGGRPGLRRIRSGSHWRATIAYIDRNPVEAGLARHAAGYAFGSARHYARATGPLWLSRELIEDFVRRESGADVYRPADYARTFGDEEVPGGAQAVVARRLNRQDSPQDPLDDLLAAAPADVRRWLEQLARRVDGAAAGPSLVDPRTLLSELKRARRKAGDWLLESGAGCGPAVLPVRRKRRGGLRRDGWSVLACGLLRTACGLKLDEIGHLVGLSDGGVHLQVGCHRRLVSADATYTARAERVLRAALRTDFPQGDSGAPPAPSWAQ